MSSRPVHSRGGHVLVVSPHFDDAVLSAGCWLAANPGSIVATVCSGLPGTDVPASKWDQALQSADAATMCRRSEDARALAILGGEQRLLGFLDSPYRTNLRWHESVEPRHTNIVAHVADALTEVVEDEKLTSMMLPLGSAHPDHTITSNAAILAASRIRIDTLVYADLPYALQSRLWLRRRMAQLTEGGVRFSRLPVPEYTEKKEEALLCYGSQIEGLPWRSTLEPGCEQLWSMDVSEASRLGFLEQPEESRKRLLRRHYRIRGAVMQRAARRSPRSAE
jgi:LmbE family N-acetylglucosaminyl deacetylase